MYLKANGIELYYETIGQGTPILLLHGNGEDHSIFDVLIGRLSQTHTVYAIDSRGHGKSSPVSRFDYGEMMEDIAALIHELKLNRPVLYGFSDGGIIGLLLAVKYPDLLSKLIVSGANVRPDGVKAGCTMLIKAGYFFTRDPKLKLMLTQPNITQTQLGQIVTPTVILAGSRDIVKDAHTKMIAESIPNSALTILDGETHASYVLHSERLYEVIGPFLEEPCGLHD